VRREAYLKRLDGMTFGENPREGFFHENAFYHPDLRFRLNLPRGFEGQNTRQALWAVSPNGDAVFQLTLAEGSSPDQAAREFFGSQGIRTVDANRTSVNGLNAVVGTFDATSGQTPVRGVAGFVLLDDRIYRMVGYTGQSSWNRYSRSLDAAMQSFGPLRERWALDRQPNRIEVVVPRRDMTLAEFTKSFPSDVPDETIAIINQLQGGQTLKAGRQAKRIRSGDERRL